MQFGMKINLILIKYNSEYALTTSVNPETRRTITEKSWIVGFMLDFLRVCSAARIVGLR